MPFAPEIQRYLRHGRWVSKKVGCVGYRWGGWVLVHLFLGRHHHRHRRTEPEEETRQATEERKQKCLSSVHNYACKEIDKSISFSLSFNRQATGAIELDGAAAGRTHKREFGTNQQKCGASQNSRPRAR